MPKKGCVLRTDLVRKIAAGFIRRLPSSSAVQFDDLYSVGLEGLAHAVQHFDPMRGQDFESYAAYRVKGAMLDELRRLDLVSRERRRAIRDGTDDPDVPVPWQVEIKVALRIPDPARDAEDELDFRRESQRLRAAVGKLPSRLQLVYRLRVTEERPLRFVSGRLGVTEARVCQLMGAIVTRLRASLQPADNRPRVLRVGGNSRL